MCACRPSAEILNLNFKTLLFFNKIASDFPFVFREYNCKCLSNSSIFLIFLQNTSCCSSKYTVVFFQTNGSRVPCTKIDCAFHKVCDNLVNISAGTCSHLSFPAPLHGAVPESYRGPSFSRRPPCPRPPTATSMLNPAASNARPHEIPGSCISSISLCWL